ncbi:peptidase [Achlya hypogyna]|uniref:Peptidase n=1 Tax=Achlya hypogyna TaxID=1202772 RepID=A0A1V9Z5T8_ACHHY|nr:peptidase [Achlya hypogyna]
MRLVSVLLALATGARAAATRDRCTAMLVGAAASASGTPMTTHSNDCSDCDFRLAKIPAMTYEANTMRPIFLPVSQYPRYVGSDRGPVYLQENLDARFFDWQESVPIGQIPQVNETYGYLEGVYGIMNEHQLAMGESTCGARFASRPISVGGLALLDITELSRIALERTTTAREAIALMGRLAETYGYYGMGWDQDDALYMSGEALTITDATEAWMFHILPDDTGASAIWAAERVPDNHIAVVANEFVIRTIDFDDAKNFMYSSNMRDIALRNGFWEISLPFDFTSTFAYTESSMAGSTRRVWRVFSLANPDLDLSPFTDLYASNYPFSVPTSRVLSAADLMAFQRDHYEGTEFDLTKGPAAGPYGDPDRYSVGSAGAGGRFERAVSIFTSTYSFVAVANAKNADLGLLWFGPYAPDANTYIPLFAKIATVPALLSQGSLRSFDFNSTYWLHAVLGNYAAHFYKFTHPVVAQTQVALENAAVASLVDMETVATVMGPLQGDAAVTQYLTTTAEIFTQQAHNVFMALFSSVVTRFHDGFVMSNATQREMTVTPMGYPDWYLKSVGYFDPVGGNVDSSVGAAIFIVLVVIVAVSVGVGFYVGRIRAAKKRGYVYIQ